MSDVKSISLWAKELSTPNTEVKLPVFKIASGSKEITFLNDGRKWKDEVYDREYVIYKIMADGKPHVWFVSMKAFGLLNTISRLGFPLNGKRGVVSRIGSGRKDTRWSLTTEESQEQQ